MNEEQTRSSVGENGTWEEENTLGRGASSEGETNGGGAEKTMGEEIARAIWLPVVGYESTYEVSRSGAIRRSGRFIRQRLTSNGYARVQLCQRGIESTVLVHRLVAMAFLPIPQNRRNQVNHKNGNKIDNTVDNLEWTTAKENCRHAVDTGLAPLGDRNASRKYPGLRAGERNGRSKLNLSKVLAIRQMSKDGVTASTMAAQLNISIASICNVIRNKTWKQV